MVATRNRRELALRTVERLRDLPESPPVVVVDDGSTDRTAEAVRARFEDVEVISLRTRRGVTAARNAGVRAATTPFVAFADDDSWWAAGALGAAARVFGRQPRLALVAARVLVGEERRLDPTCAAMAASPLSSQGLPGPRVLGFVACGAVVRREAFLAVGGFPERYVIGGEEEPLALALASAGWDLAYVDEVVAHHAPTTARRDESGRSRRTVRNDLWTAWRHRRAAGALARSAVVIAGADTGPGRVGVVQALAALPWALAHRRPVPPQVEEQRRLLAGAGAGADEPARRAGAPWVPAVAAARRARTRARVVDHRRPDPRDVDSRVAVVVMTHNRVGELLPNLRRLCALPERPHVVVVDNGSSDGTAAAVRSDRPEVELVALADNIGAAARNVAVERLSQPYVAFADDDTWWEPGSLREAADVLDAHPDLAAVTARILVEPQGSEDPVVADMRESPLPDVPGLPGRPLVSVLAGATVLRCTAFREVGGFEPRFRIGGEEELLAADLLAAGWQLRFLPQLTVHHAPSRARDPHRRRADGLRNTLWFAWLRRRLPRAAWRTAAVLRGAPHDRVTALAVAEAAAGLPWVVRERRRLPAPVERQLRLMDVEQLGSEARRYVS